MTPTRPRGGHSMPRSRFLHHHAPDRARQLRWVVPLLALLLGAALATLAVQYRLSDRAVGTEFFRAHKTISHTGELPRTRVFCRLHPRRTIREDDTTAPEPPPR